MVNLEKIDRLFERIGMEWTYLLWSPSFWYKGKVGHSKQMSIRLEQITESIRKETGKEVNVYVIFKMPMFAARKAEKAIHNCALWRRAYGMPGSGYTEWGHVTNAYAFILAYILLYAFDLPLQLSLIILAAPIPIDFAVFIFLIAIFQYSVAALAVFGIWNILF